MSKLADIFTAKPLSVYEVICDRNNVGFYLPAYQRPYSWEPKHISDLFKDFESVFRNLLESENAIIFLGSILTVDAFTANTTEPKPGQQNPSIINIIIDGQQRLTTLTLIILCLNEKLRILEPSLKRLIDRVPKDSNPESLENLKETVSQLIKDTSNFVIETSADHQFYKYFPKIVRAQDDKWGKNERGAKYTSSVAELLHKFQKHIIESKDNPKGSFKEFDLNDLENKSDNVIDNVKIIRKYLSSIEEGFTIDVKNEDANDPLTLSELFSKNSKLQDCLRLFLDAELLQYAEVNENKSTIKKIVFIAAFTKFLMHRVCLTYVEVNNESYAFDMFEALNTTGEPLTAIETFVPKVYEFIHTKNDSEDLVYSQSESDTESLLKSITDRFEGDISSKDKNDKTKSLINAFIRAYSGKVKVTSLRDQRDALLKSFDSCKFPEKHDYIRYLSKSAEFLFDFWYSNEPNLADVVPNEERDIANLSFQYIIEINHGIVLPLLIQFLLQDEKFNKKGLAISNFYKVLKAITAFSVLWRTMTGGAEGIDNVYKKIHEQGFYIVDKKIEPYQLSRGITRLNSFNVDDIKAFFRQELEIKIRAEQSPKETMFEQWLDICASKPILDKPKNLRMLILAAYHHIKLEENNFIRSNEAKLNFLTPTMWKLLSKKNVIKKIYSPTICTDWGDYNLSNPSVFNRLGNVVIDTKEKIIVGKDLTWDTIKTAMLIDMKNVSLQDLDALSEMDDMSESHKENISTTMLIRKYAELTHWGQWNSNAIEERTKLLLSNAWENLYEWLE